jgi:hypothetical protein
LEINHNQVRLGLAEHLNCFPTVAGLIADKPIGVVIQQPAQATSDGRAIVRYKDPNQ